jgi:hypothetical protein
MGQSRTVEAPALAGLHRLCSVELSERLIEHVRRVFESGTGSPGDSLPILTPRRSQPIVARDWYDRRVAGPLLAWPDRDHSELAQFERSPASHIA